ncbi:hypothetical protein D3C78_1489000 [compost metagenome]
MLAGHQIMVAQRVGRCLDRISGNKNASRRRRMQEGVTDNAARAVALTRNLSDQWICPYTGSQYHRVGCNTLTARQRDAVSIDRRHAHPGPWLHAAFFQCLSDHHARFGPHTRPHFRRSINNHHADVRFAAQNGTQTHWHFGGAFQPG